MQNTVPNVLGDRRSTRRVLLVEDDEDVRELVALAIGHLGHEVIAVPDGQSALHAVTTHCPEVAFLDIDLPDMDGYALARRVRQLRHPSNIRLIAFTGFGTPSDRERALRCGFDDHLAKPATLEDIEAALSAFGATGATDHPCAGVWSSGPRANATGSS
jgi:CheY-like chemotaxis protein